MRLSGKVALITGASRGIGKHVAEAFAREGARLFLVGHPDEARRSCGCLRPAAPH
jgi:NAD(P)-dependent dehydrogenase (short-subunit alcohol dehydrogenase family)